MILIVKSLPFIHVIFELHLKKYATGDHKSYVNIEQGVCPLSCYLNINKNL